MQVKKDDLADSLCFIISLWEYMYLSLYLSLSDLTHSLHISLYIYNYLSFPSFIWLWSHDKHCAYKAVMEEGSLRPEPRPINISC